MELQNRSKFDKLAKQFKLELMLLFGSQASGKGKADSDVDVGVLPEKELDDASCALLSHQLGELFGNYNIDLSALRHIGPLLSGQIAKNCQLLYEKEKGAFAKFRFQANKRYADAQPLFKVKDGYLRRKIEKYQKEI